MTREDEWQYEFYDLEDLTESDIHNAIHSINSGRVVMDDYGKASKSWFVLVNGKNYDLKRLLRIAYRIRFGHSREYNFHTGKGRKILRGLGFEVVDLAPSKGRTSRRRIEPEEGFQGDEPAKSYSGNQESIDKCFQIFGRKCKVCGMEEEKAERIFSAPGLHIHHKQFFFDEKAPDDADAQKELVPICPRCHNMIHAFPGKIRTIRDVQNLLIKERREKLGL